MYHTFLHYLISSKHFKFLLTLSNLLPQVSVHTRKPDSVLCAQRLETISRISKDKAILILTFCDSHWQQQTKLGFNHNRAVAHSRNHRNATARPLAPCSVASKHAIAHQNNLNHSSAITIAMVRESLVHRLHAYLQNFRSLLKTNVSISSLACLLRSSQPSSIWPALGLCQPCA